MSKFLIKQQQRTHKNLRDLVPPINFKSLNLGKFTIKQKLITLKDNTELDKFTLKSKIRI